MQLALALSVEALDTSGTEPFGAVAVRDGVAVGEGFSHSLANFDPTSHGEVEAIRDACRKLKSVSLDRCGLYTSCEPCALCVAAMRIVGIRKLFYAASLDESSAAFEGLPVSARHPINVDDLQAQAGANLDARSMPSEQQLATPPVEILRRWAAPRKQVGDA